MVKGQRGNIKPCDVQPKDIRSHQNARKLGQATYVIGVQEVTEDEKRVTDERPVVQIMIG